MRAGFYPSAQRRVEEPLVLLHGWGCDARVWQGLVGRLNAYFDIDVLDLPGFGGNRHLPLNESTLAELLPKRCYVLGWSLGGMLAVALAARVPEKVAGVVTLAANAKFVADDHWPQAMAAQTFEQFKSGASKLLAPTLKRFAHLLANQQTKSAVNDLREDLLSALDQNPDAAYLPTLNWLQSIDNRQQLSQMAVPSLHLYGEHDQLVPVQAAQAIEKLLVKAPVVGDVHVLPTDHCLHLCDPGAVTERVVRFIEANKPQRNKRKVAASFSRAAPNYDSVARVQNKVGDRLLSLFRRTTQRKVTDRILDLGSGTGVYSELLSRERTRNCVISADFAQGMLEYARTQQQGSLFCSADAESLPFASASFDAVFSSLMVQWCENSAAVLSELHRILKPGGCALIATLGPGTLYELRQSWQQVDSDPHVNQFTSAKVWLMQAAQMGYARVEYKKEPITEYYDTLPELLQSLKVLGARNVNSGRALGLGGRQKIADLTQAYELQRTQFGLPISYQVDYLILEK